MRFKMSLSQSFILVTVCCVALAVTISRMRETRMYRYGDSCHVLGVRVVAVHKRVEDFVKARNFMVCRVDETELEQLFVEPYSTTVNGRPVVFDTLYYAGTLADETRVVLKVGMAQNPDARSMVLVCWSTAAIGPKNMSGRFDERRQNSVKQFLAEFRNLFDNLSNEHGSNGPQDGGKKGYSHQI